MDNSAITRLKMTIICDHERGRCRMGEGTFRMRFTRAALFSGEPLELTGEVAAA